MRATEFIRDLLDVIDKVDADLKMNKDETEKLPPEEGETVANRFNSVFKMIQAKNTQKQYPNSPNEIITDIDSVTTDAGGAQVHPDDIRVKDPRGYE